uniref:Uncharacterized protein n=1 Tax=Culex tarsalis TaxID=7177 RepID=A0A1Q3F9J3_CULTA
MQKKPVNRVCFIPGCTSEYGQVLFLSAYKSNGLQQWWSESAWSRNRKNKTIPKNTRVCERHFEEKFIDRSYKMPRLFPDAWPTMNVAEPTAEDLEGRGRCRIDGRGRPPGRTEANPKHYCRLCGKREKRPLEDLMFDLRDGEELLKFCLGQYYSRPDLPQGVCDDCMDTAESFVEFVRKCEETQLKLERIFVQNEALKLEPDCELLESAVQLKQEKLEEPEDMQVEYLEQPQDSPRDVKPVELITSEDPPPEDYGEEPPDGLVDDGDGGDGFISDHSYEDSKSVAAEEHRPRRRRKSRVSVTSEEEDSFEENSEDDDSDSEDDKPLRKRQIVEPKKRGRKPKQKLLEDYENETKPKERRGRKKSTSGASQETSRICPICGKILIHKGNFTSHLKIHSEKKDYVCNICGKQYYIRRELQMHIESLHEKKTFVCNICGIKCAWRKGLQRHMKNKHSDESSLKHKCTYCGKAFLLPNQLRLHVMKHTGDRITCEICGAGYRFNYMLTQHKMREHGMEFKGVKLYKNSNRSRKSAKQAAASASATQPEPGPPTSQPPPPPPSTTPAVEVVTVAHILEPSHDSMLSSESSQSHPIQQQGPPPSQQQQHHHPQQHHQHHVAAQLVERGPPGHYPPGFVYPGGHATAAPAMMLPPGSYSG